MSLYDEYEGYVLKYKAEYGDRTVVLYQCGSFYEVYSCGDGNVNIKEVAELLNIQVSRRNKAILEVNRSNTLMAGFPEYTLGKFQTILVENNYTVVIVSQVSPPPKPRRAVTNILSPGTLMQVPSSVETNIMMSIYIDNWVCGVATIDVTTGEVRVAEFGASTNDIMYAFDEVYRLITVNNPREIIVFGESTLAYNMIAQHMELNSKYVHNKLNQGTFGYDKISYQNEFIKKVYGAANMGFLSPIEYLDMETMPHAIVAMIMVLQFAYKHNENIIKKVSLPTKNNPIQHLNISYNAANQLNMASLLSIINKASTAIGRRYFKDRLYNPSVNIEEINKSYDNIESANVGYQKNLENVYDLERLFRKVRLGTIHPADWMQIVVSLENLVTIGGVPPAAQEMLEECRRIFDMNEIAKYHLDNITVSFFNKGVFPEIDQIQCDFDQQVDFFTQYAQFLEPSFRVESNERDGYFITTTNKRFNDNKTRIKESIYTWGEHEIKGSGLLVKPVSSSSSNVKITHEVFNIVNQKILESKKMLCDAVLDTYKNSVVMLESQYGDTFDKLTRFVGETDFYVTCARIAKEYKYVRPTLSSNQGSYFAAKGLRHPIVERVQLNLEYVANDVNLSSNQSMLLYGINSAGKSTLMKSVGIAVIMAQSGMFVAADELELGMFHKVFTRIPSGDDIMKGQSTFTVEVGELRNILKRADKNSLVIGDELCSGTESVSALSIVSAGIVELVTRNVPFVFASHLHDLTGISKIKDLIKANKLQVRHLEVWYDDATGKLIYNRKLQEGQGNTLYGLEVCKSLNMGKEFIDMANEIRREIMGVPNEILDPKSTSYYNAGKYVHDCVICGEPATDTHHIKEQHLADKDGFIGRIHKNELHNLMALCKKCHGDVHKGVINISGYVQTSHGIEPRFSLIKN